MAKHIDKDTENMFDDVTDEMDNDLEQDSMRHRRNGSGFEAKGGSLALMILGLVVAVILFALFFRGCNSPTKEDLGVFKTRMDQLEEKVNRLDALGKKIAPLEGQVNGVQQNITRLETVDKSFKERLDKLTQDMEKNQEKAAPRAPQPSAQLKPVFPSTPSATKYHNVIAGDTLFGIAKKYNISVDQLRKLNGLDPRQGGVKIGQKLLVSP